MLSRRYKVVFFARGISLFHGTLNHLKYFWVLFSSNHRCWICRYWRNLSHFNVKFVDAFLDYSQQQCSRLSCSIQARTLCLTGIFFFILWRVKTHRVFCLLPTSRNVLLKQFKAQITPLIWFQILTVSLRTTTFPSFAALCASSTHSSWL